MQFYKVHDDGLRRRHKDEMIERAKSGLQVVFIYDEISSSGLPKSYTRELEAAGIRVSSFHTTQGTRNKFQLNFRNHRKIVVVDGRTAWVGGHNVGDEYLGLDPEFSPWRDTHVRIDGPFAVQAQAVVAVDWYWAQRELLELNWVPELAPDADMNAIVVATGPADPLETVGMFFVHALHSAKQRIWITAPYFVPDDAVVKALMLATLRGVDVRILVPGKGDSLPVQMASYYYMWLLKDSNVRFCAFEPGFMHQKVMLVDDTTSSIGTHNFDNRSFRLNFEITAIVFDPEFAGQVAQMLTADFDISRQMSISEVEAKPLWFKTAARAAYLSAPLQ